MTTRVLLDVDTGVDDALAILFAVAHPEIELLGITCVAGNTTLENVVANTLVMLDVAGAGEVPVAAGATRPLLEPARTSHVHGSDGLGDLGLPRSSRTVDPRHAVVFARDLLLASDEPVTLVTVAPQTNVALLLRQYPEVVPHLDRVVFMGGAASGGNATPVAEFNVWHDPEAAAIVLDSGVQAFMYGLDVFNRVTVEPADTARLSEGAGAAGQVAARLLRSQTDGGHIGDAGALVAVVDPDVVGVERLPVRVELSGYARGQTIVDRRRRVGEDTIHGTHDARSLVDVALDIDEQRAARLFVEMVATLP